MTDSIAKYYKALIKLQTNKKKKLLTKLTRLRPDEMGFALLPQISGKNGNFFGENPN